MTCTPATSRTTAKRQPRRGGRSTNGGGNFPPTPQTYELQSDVRTGPGWTGRGWRSTDETFLHTENGKHMEVVINRTWGKANRAMGMTKDPEYMQVDIKYCIWLPSHVAVTRVAQTRNSVEVAYILHWKKTQLGTLAESAPFTRANMPLTQTVSGTVTFAQEGRDGPWMMSLNPNQ